MPRLACLAIAGLVLLLSMDQSAAAAEKKARNSRDAAVQGADPVYVWPFKQTEKELGVEYKERQVTVTGAEVREWQTGAGDPLVGRVVCVTESTVFLEVLGKRDYLGAKKESLTPADRKYVNDLEVALAKKMGEPPVSQPKSTAAKKPAPVRKTR